MGARQRRRRWLAALGLLVLLLAAPARADKVDDLIQVLGSDDSYKVRVQAALVLGKLKDKRAVPSLVKALVDENPTVRAVAAQALGAIGDDKAVSALKKASISDESEFVRREAQQAIKKLSASSTVPTPSAARFFMALGPMTGKSKKVSADSVEIFKNALQRELGKTPGVTLEPGGDRGRTGYWIDGSIVRLTVQQQGGFTEITCDVKVLVASWPGKAIIMWTDGGATVQTGASDPNGRKDCIEAATQSIQQNIAAFLKAQG
jgi:hypothetical protein